MTLLTSVTRASYCSCVGRASVAALMTRVLTQRVSPEARTNGDLIHFVHDAEIDDEDPARPPA
jgi:hypothetical protein